MKLRKYVALVGLGFKTMLVYRVAFLFMAFGSLITVGMLYCFWRAVFESAGTIEGMSFTMMSTYVVISHFVSGLVGYFFVEFGISEKIRDGTIAVEIAQPLDFQVRKLFETFGFVGLRGMISGVVLLSGGMLLFGITPPAGLTAAGAFAASCFFAIIIEASIGFCSGMAAFYTTNLYGSIMTRRMIADFFSGAFIPISFFPVWLRSIARLLPFQATVFIPTSIYLGTIAGQEIAHALLFQAGWATAMLIIGRTVWLRVVRRLEVNGG